MLCKAPSVSWAKPSLFVRKTKYFPSKENALLFERKKMALRKEKNFRAHGEKFSYVRKNIFVRKKISLPSKCDKTH